MTVASADFGKCTACANHQSCAKRTSREQASRLRTLDLVSAIGCFGFVLFVLISCFAPMLSGA